MRCVKTLGWCSTATRWDVGLQKSGFTTASRVVKGKMLDKRCPVPLENYFREPVAPEGSGQQTQVRFHRTGSRFGREIITSLLRVETSIGSIRLFDPRYPNLELP